MRKIALGLAALLMAGSAALAQTPLTFADVDTDGNGELSFAELQVVWPDLTQQEFDLADIDGSGGLSIEELNSLQPSTLPSPTGVPAETPAN
ncbi:MULTISPECIES: EF-hand domain-containing protein [Devosia]|uniref:EF hand n=1 Tax=Devosia equisanguinis TaxID=2490941 RepID=A0A447IA83_9HYPH|nr:MULTISPECIES: EF-hand domain-containing protein [Devosia]ODT49477.1 MAG: hypothetical protein ABS74_08190 [Pelagibacterium sp. SCN 63-126]ODU81700.1 MAG: hypothetical protein ABT14_17735 [Pelagibacterium sp. SCN 63-17]OJX41858.1 MAG: hypothetical protein BGO80_09800 [Devosia sp. 63-57]VDS04440.1 EF hand [Devosia equisanguinis]